MYVLKKYLEETGYKGIIFEDNDKIKWNFPSKSKGFNHFVTPYRVEMAKLVTSFKPGLSKHYIDDEEEDINKAKMSD
jgi:hypothetical protein